MLRITFCVALVIVLAFPHTSLLGSQVPSGKESLVIDSMTEAKKAIGKKVLKGPVPFAHKEHADRGLECVSCHHKHKGEGEEVKPCSSCHTDKGQKSMPKLSEAFHGGKSDSMPSTHSCIGCHRRNVYAKNMQTKAPYERKPCEACHSIGK